MFCPKCGKQIADSAVFCGECGTLIPKQETQAPNTQNSAQPQVTPATVVPPTVIPQKITKPKPAKEKKTFAKSNFINALFILLITLTYTAISFLCISLLSAKDAITIQSAFNESFTCDIDFNKFLEILFSGNVIFNPTLPSTVLSLGITIFCYAVPVICGISILGTIFNKKKIRFNIATSIFSTLTSAIIILFVPLSLRFVPKLNDALSAHAGMLRDDIKAVTYTPLIITGAIILALVVISTILSVILAKRRKSNEQK